MNLKELGETIGLEEEEYRELLGLMVLTGRQDHARLAAAVAQGDGAVAARIAHTMCGAAGNLRLMALYEQLKGIEAAAAADRLEGLAAAVEVVAAELERLAAHI